MNIAHGRGSFAAGIGSNANDNGDFVWSDDPSGGGVTPIAVTGNNQFLARARGGVKFYSSANLASGVSLAPGSGTWSSLSDRNAKTGIVPVTDDDILARVAMLPISEWSYTTERGVRHVEPMAQDPFAAFTSAKITGTSRPLTKTALRSRRSKRSTGSWRERTRRCGRCAPT